MHTDTPGAAGLSVWTAVLQRWQHMPLKPDMAGGLCTCNNGWWGGILKQQGQDQSHTVIDARGSYRAAVTRSV